jgi:hypothetical protein
LRGKVDFIFYLLFTVKCLLVFRQVCKCGMARQEAAGQSRFIDYCYLKQRPGDWTDALDECGMTGHMGGMRSFGGKKEEFEVLSDSIQHCRVESGLCRKVLCGTK